MNVEAILRTKGRNIVTIDGTKTLADAARMLDSHGIGALVVDGEDGLAVGILSERDIVREVALSGAEALDRRVCEAMSQPLVTAGVDAGIGELMVLMTDRRVRHLPIVHQGSMVGLVSIGDVVKARIADMEAETAALHAYISS